MLEEKNYFLLLNFVSGGKKGKKKKGKTLNLTEFLSSSGEAPPIQAKKLDWADEADDFSGEGEHKLFIGTAKCKHLLCYLDYDSLPEIIFIHSW